jgi:3-(methylthio)propionyl---CoA ligase
MSPSRSPYDTDLDKNPANHQALTPLTFLRRAAAVYPENIAVVHESLQYTYKEFYKRCRQLASALERSGFGLGDTIAVLAPNVPTMLDAHYGVPMMGGVLNAINYRLNAKEVAFILDHGEAKVFIVDGEFGDLAREALSYCEAKPLLIDIDDPTFPEGTRISETNYEEFLASGDTEYDWQPPEDEWQAISLNYTSGTTGNPKGVVFHHRGANIMSLGLVIAGTMPSTTTYLWTLPMFHCNGWCYTWALSVVAGTHVCLRRITAKNIFEACKRYKVTHMCGAPIIMSMIINAAEDERQTLDNIVEFHTAAAPPPASVIGAMEKSGFAITHLYGLTETYGPSAINAWHDEWDGLPDEERANVKARQGVNMQILEGLTVMDPETMEEVPRDGETIGEVMFRGNVVMKGYLKNPKASQEAFAHGWFHSGDLGVLHSDGYIQLKDRSKDIIISGGENISSIEVEDALYKHPDIVAAAVVAKPDDKWGETPCAFIEVRDGASVTQDEVIAFCREHLAHFKCPRNVIVTELPKTSTGKIQKFKLRDRVEET